MKRCTRRGWAFWIVASGCVLTACGGNNDEGAPASEASTAESAKFATPAASVGGAIRGASFAPRPDDLTGRGVDAGSAGTSDGALHGATPMSGASPNTAIDTPDTTSEPKPVPAALKDESGGGPKSNLPGGSSGGGSGSVPGVPSGGASGGPLDTHKDRPADAGNPPGGAHADAPSALVSPRATLAVGGTVEGLATNTPFKLFNNDDELLYIDKNGAFQFGTYARPAEHYSVSVAIHPRGQFCTVDGAQGTVGEAPVKSIKVACKPREQIAIATNEKLTQVVSFRVDGNTGLLHRVPGDGVNFHALGRRLMMSPSGTFALTVRTDLPRGKDRSWPRFSRGIRRFSIDTSTGQLGKLEDFEWASRSGQVLDYALSQRGDSLTVLQDEKSYGVIGVELPKGEALRAVAYADDQWVKEPSRKPNMNDCPRPDLPNTLANRLDLVGNFRLTDDGRFGYMLRCDFDHLMYRLERYVVEPNPRGLVYWPLGVNMDKARFSNHFAIDSRHGRIYSIDAQTRVVRTLRIDKRSGALEPMHEAALPFAANQIVLSRDGRTAYIVHPANHAISVWDVNLNTGRLMQLYGSPHMIGGEPHKLVLDASETFGYVLLNGTRAIGIYTLNPSSRAFRWVHNVPMDDGVGELAFTP